MNLKYNATMAVMLSLSVILSAQQTFYHTDKNRLYTRASELYQNGKYSAAQQLFDEYYQSHNKENSDLASNSEYYSALCAVKLFNNDAESRVQAFLNRNPENPQKNDIIYSLAGYFYQRKNYTDALEYYEKVDYSKLSREEQAEYYFKRGYCYFLKEDFDKARFSFSQIKDQDNKYTTLALYYYSHINYAQGNYATALDGFLRLKNDQNFGPIIPYYLTQIYYQQKKYDEVIKYVPSMTEGVNEKRASEVAKITGESYAQLSQYEESIPYLEKYIETARTVSREDKYTLAYAYYKTQNYSKAAELFGQTTGVESPLSQNALYLLGDCQLKLGEKNKALMAFFSASKMEFDPEIKEDALFNYALLTYELDYSPFNESIQALNEYLDRYPDSKRSDEVNNYLVMAYMNAKNYRLALSSIDKIRNKDNEMKKAYQKIAYYRGLELFSNLSFQEAIDMLTQSIRYGNFDNRYYALSLYWKGEAWYRSGDYQKAIDNYTSFLAQPGVSGYDEYALAQYGLGYCNFNLKKYAEAIPWFNRFVNQAKNLKQEVLTDTYNRMGDCYFIQMAYNNAIAYYNKAINSGKGNVEYAMFQKGIVLGVIGKDSEKISTLNELSNSYPNSSLKADIIFQMAESYVKLNQTDEAISTYNKLINDHPNSSYVKKSLLNLGLLYFNVNRNSEAIKSYQQVIADYPGTDEAKNALIGLKNVYVSNNDADGYYTYVKGMGVLTSADLIEQDSLSYLSAEKIYMTGNYSRAAESFENYIKNHPEGRFLLNAYFYKGDCYYRANKYNEALASFDYIIGRPTSKFTEPSLLGASRIKFRLKDYAAAAEYYHRLEEFAEVKSNVMEARMGMLKCYTQLKEYDKIVELADKIMITEKLSPEQERETRFAKAMALLARDRQMLALDEFKKVASEVKSAEGAESKYRIAEIYYKRNDLDNAEKEISDFADKTTPHQYWMAKSFLLWADIFRDKGDDFQARQTLQSLIDYYEKSNDGILDEAKEKLRLLNKNTEENKGKPAEEQDMEINMEGNHKK
jgi:tetratricopeptide (TPR) repeat protein